MLKSLNDDAVEVLYVQEEEMFTELNMKKICETCICERMLNNKVRENL